jgi:hypothetical protein
METTKQITDTIPEDKRDTMKSVYESIRADIAFIKAMIEKWNNLPFMKGS